MKRKFFSLVLAFVFILTGAMCLTACGDRKSNKLTIKAASFDIEGIQTVSVYYTDNPDSFTNGDNDSLKNLSESRLCYDNARTNKYDPAEIDEGQYAGIIAIRLKQSHDRGNLDVVINGKQSALIKVSEAFESYPFGSFDYIAVIGKDGKFSSDLTITFTGNTTVKTYTPTVTIKNYNPDDTRYNDLKFEFYKNDNVVQVSGKTVLTGSDAVPVEDAANTSKFDLPSATYFEQYKLVVHFSTSGKFFPSNSCLNSFNKNGTSPRINNNYEVVWFMSHKDIPSGFINDTAEDGSITLDFSAFDTVKMSDVAGERDITVDDMTGIKKVEFEYVKSDESYGLRSSWIDDIQIDYGTDHHSDGCYVKDRKNLKMEIEYIDDFAPTTATLKLTITRTSGTETANLVYSGDNWQLEGTNANISFQNGHLTINYDDDVTKVKIETAV